MQWGKASSSQASSNQGSLEQIKADYSRPIQMKANQALEIFAILQASLVLFMSYDLEAGYKY